MPNSGNRQSGGFLPTTTTGDNDVQHEITPTAAE